MIKLVKRGYLSQAVRANGPEQSLELRGSGALRPAMASWRNDGVRIAHETFAWQLYRSRRLARSAFRVIARNYCSAISESPRVCHVASVAEHR